ncbi:MAG: cell wall hydrolase [Paenibacillus sp.]|uniref:N-acetylmuramoyl-L-alanine amidase n=1 Tax=Paenibacillus sp. GCM10012303 TaxID=3317340 RepID=UPI0029F1FEAD|nr:cell wall hydrolase [Paenibacillus sp.]
MKPPIARKAVLVLGMMLCISLPVTEKAHAGDTYSARVTADHLNVRSEPAASSKIVSSLSNGAVITVSDEAYGWLKIKVGQKTGWVAGQYVKKLSNSTATAGSTAASPAKTATTNTSKSEATPKSAVGNATASKHGVVSADKLWMRSGPGTNNEATELLQKGAALTIVKRENGWLQVRTTASKTGWVSGRYVDETGGSVTAQAVRKTGGLSGKVIVLDPGHGGDDPGVIGNKYKTIEKTINLSTAQYVAEELRRAGAKVVMTRTNDKEQPELSQRAALGSKQQADAFVSIHYNASPKKVSGTLTFYYSESKDRPLARSIEARLGQGVGIKSNGISYGDYHVLRENKQPSVLLELGFLTDAGDESVVRKDDYQRKAARAIAAGLNDYFGG